MGCESGGDSLRVVDAAGMPAHDMGPRAQSQMTGVNNVEHRARMAFGTVTRVYAARRLARARGFKLSGTWRERAGLS